MQKGCLLFKKLSSFFYKITYTHNQKLNNTMTTSSIKYLQIFAYNTPGINKDNRFPLICFQNLATELNFVNALISRPCSRLIDEPYFVINNPQLLPYDDRKFHMHDSVEYDDETGEEVIRRRDNCYSICDNLELLVLQNIHNNSLENTGFREALHDLMH